MERYVSVSKSVRNTLLLTALLALPVALVWFLKGRTHSAKTLPVFGEPLAVNAPGDTVYHTIPPFAFTDQWGDDFTEKNFKGKISVVNFFFARCPEICPKMNENMKLVQRQFKDNPGVVFLSHTVDPDNDSVPVLAEYSARMGVKKGDNWHFVTGIKSNLYLLAQNAYFVTAMPSPVPADFIHSEKLILLDEQRRIRGYYDGLDYKEMLRLKDEIKVLLFHLHAAKQN